MTSTLPTAPPPETGASAPPKPRRWLAALLAALLVIGGTSFGAATAMADELAPAPVLSVTPATDVDPAVENTFTVSGTGYVGAGAANGAYVLLGAQSVWQGGGPLVSTGWLAQAWVPAAQIVGGAFTTTITIPAGTFDSAVTYQVASSAAHGLSVTNRTLDAFAPITVRQPAPPEPVANPVLSFTPATDVDPAVENTFTVSGTGYVGAGAASGAYVLIGAQSVWQGGSALPGSGWLAQAWVPAAQIVGGAFTTTVKIPAGTFDPKVTYQVASSAAHGLSVTNRTLDAFAPITVKQPAPVATPVLSVTPATDVDAAVANTFTVSGTGYIGPGAASGAYVLIGARSVWQGGSALPGAGWLAQAWVPAAQIVNGGFTTTITVPAAKFDPSLTYQVASSAAHGLSVTNRTLDAFAPITIKQPAPEPATPSLTVSKTEGLDPAGEDLTITAEHYATGFTSTYAPGEAGFYLQVGWLADTWKPSEKAPSSSRTNAYNTWVADEANTIAPTKWTKNADGTADVSWTVEVTKAALDAKAKDGYTLAVFTLGAGGAVQAANELAVPISFEPATPSLSVSKTEGLDPAGEDLTITAEHYATGFTSSYAPGEAGFYIQVGWLADTWKASEKAPSAARTNAYNTWVADEANTIAPTKWTKNPDGTANASWTVNVTKAELDAKAKDGYTLAVFTLGAGGAVQAANELAVPISFGAPIEAPKLSVEPVAGVDPATKNTLTITGTGFTGAGAANGAYVLVGETSIWNGQGPLVNDGWIASTWVPTSKIVDGSFTTSFTIAAGSFDRSKSYQVASSAAHGLSATDRSLDAFAPIKLLASTGGGNTGGGNGGNTGGGNGGNTGGGTTTPPVVIAAGSLDWGVSSSFREYIISDIAKGSIAVGGGASSNGSSFRFVQSGSSFSPITTTGSADYAGTVRFTGHDGALDLTLTNPTLVAKGVGSAALVVTANGNRVEFATVDLSSAARSTVDGATRFDNAPVTLTSAGSAAFDGRYEPGRSLDPLTVVIGSAGVAAGGNGGGTVVVASASSSTAAAKKSYPATPPATTGIVLDAASLEALGAGQRVTVTAGGFEPNESDVAAVVYSTPIVLADDLSADASGNVSWTGSIPASLEPGVHTLTFQGSTNVGVQFTVPAEQAGACKVTAGSLDWGFKESFRSYLTSGIANGDWTLTGVTEDAGVFTFVGGSGSLEESGRGVLAYTGSVEFTGHDGALDTTIANPKVELDGEGGAILLLDVAGTTQDGAPVDLKSVRFAELDLGEGVTVVDGVLTGEAAAVLTADGAAAFGTYPADEELDPVSFTATVSSDCVVAAPASVETAEVESDAKAVEAVDQAADTGSAWWIWALSAALLVIVLAIVAVLVIRSRRSSTES
ncbi:Htaa protein [Agromyces sp. CF514]|uniref:HtaA domain-containing protein n=1 Tax=Agromyces sp. CF514 TaxID=1881031 RepID=UPI0008F42E0F|nr:HtaA domain-containing protein [Agromyces sp. CF514]SFR92070.1 Htaa protein [Agromyces sp. CF514]